MSYPGENHNQGWLGPPEGENWPEGDGAQPPNTGPGTSHPIYVGDLPDPSEPAPSFKWHTPESPPAASSSATEWEIPPKRQRTEQKSSNDPPENEYWNQEYANEWLKRPNQWPSPNPEDNPEKTGDATTSNQSQDIQDQQVSSGNNVEMPENRADSPEAGTSGNENPSSSAVDEPSQQKDAGPSSELDSEIEQRNLDALNRVLEEGDRPQALQVQLPAEMRDIPIPPLSPRPNLFELRPVESDSTSSTLCLSDLSSEMRDLEVLSKVLEMEAREQRLRNEQLKRASSSTEKKQ